MCHGQSTVYRFGLSIIINYWVSLTLWWYDHAPGYCRSSGCFLLVDHDHVPWLGATLLMGWPNNYIIYACGLWKFVKPPCFFDIYRWLSDFSIKKHNVPINKHHFPIKKHQDSSFRANMFQHRVPGIRGWQHHEPQPARAKSDLIG